LLIKNVSEQNSYVFLLIVGANAYGPTAQKTREIEHKKKIKYTWAF